MTSYMCGQMNRKGWLCKDCIDGFGPSVTSVGYKCTNNCADDWYRVLLYQFLEFVPITAFYLVVLTFRIRMTSAPMTCFILYCQLVMLEIIINGGSKVDKFTENSFFFQAVLFVYGIWNL